MLIFPALKGGVTIDIVFQTNFVFYLTLGDGFGQRFRAEPACN